MRRRLLVVVRAGLFMVLLAAVLSPEGRSPPEPTTVAGPEPELSSLAVSVETLVPDAATPTTPAPEPLPPPRTFTLVATGDVLLHTPLWEQARADAASDGDDHDFRPMLAGIEPVVSGADVAICHMETPVAPPGGPYSSYPSFSVPPEITDALADTGYDACTTASNHTYDRSAEGVDRTLDALEASGIEPAGSSRSPQEAEETTLLDVDGVNVALLSYTYGFNGIPAPNGETWRSNLIDQDRILADASTARQRGAEVVVVSLHWGDEYRHDPSGQQQELAPPLIRSPDIDLLLGHHAHVVQPVESIDGEWVVYGMGNLVSNQGSLGPEKLEGLLVRFTFTETASGWQTTEAELTPVLTDDRGPIRVHDVGRALADPSTDPGLRSRLELARDRTTAIVRERGATESELSPIE